MINFLLNKNASIFMLKLETNNEIKNRLPWIICNNNKHLFIIGFIQS